MKLQGQQKDLLLILAESDSEKRIEDLSEMIGTCEKTTRNYLNRLSTLQLIKKIKIKGGKFRGRVPNRYQVSATGYLALAESRVNGW